MPYDFNYGNSAEQNQPAGGAAPFAADRQGAALNTQLHVNGFVQAVRGRLFYAYSTPGILSVVGTAMTGLILWNGSPAVNLVLRKVNLRVSVTSASMTGIDLCATTAGAQTAVPTSVTAATKTGSTFLGNATSLVSAYSVATTQTTVSIASLIHNTAAIATTGLDSVEVDLGGWVIPPLTCVGLAALGGASAAAAVSSAIYWEEVPV